MNRLSYTDLGSVNTSNQSVSVAVYNKGGVTRYIDGPAIPSYAFSELEIYRSYNGSSTVSNGAEYDSENNRIKILSEDVDRVMVRFNVKDGKDKKYRMYVEYNIIGGKIVYDANGGTFVNGQPDPIILDFEESIPTEYIPTANEGIYEVQLNTADFVEWVKEPDVDVMGKYGLNVYTVWNSRIGLTFDLNYSGDNAAQLTVNGGTDTSSVLENGKLKVVENHLLKEVIDENQISATRPGYTFKGWTLDSLGKRPITDETTMLARDMTLFAQWEADTHTLTLLSNVDTSDENQPSQESLTLEVKTDERIIAAIESKYGTSAITRPEYKLNGWAEDVAGEKTLNTTKVMPAQDLTVYAKWRRFSSTMNEDIPVSDVFIDNNFRSYIYSSIFGKTEPAEGENFTQEYMDAIRNTTYLNISNKSISDLSGLSNFENLITLECKGNSITELDVSKINTLKYLGCSSNPIKNLILGEAPIINRLTIDSCGLNELDVSKCTELTNLLCYSNNLNTLDVSKNTKLNLLECQDNKLEVLDLSNNPELTNLNCSNNAINKIDLSSNTKLTTTTLGPQNLYLEVSKNEGDSTYTVLLGQGIPMAEGDSIVSQYSSETGNVTWNDSSEVDNFTYNCDTHNGNLTMQVNVYSMVPVVLNVNGGTFTTTGETDNKTVLYKVKTQTSDICSEITNNSNYAVDSGSYIFVAWRPTCESLNGDGCELKADWVETIEGHTFKEVFTDVNFRSFVINTVLATEVGISENSLITANHQQMLLTVSQLDVSGKAIKSLEGIKYFANLENLKCDNNNLQKLDLSGFEVLKECTCENQTTNVILSKDESDQWQVQLPENLVNVSGLTDGSSSYNSITGLVTWNSGTDYDESFTYEYTLSNDLGNMTVTVKPSMSLKFDADGGKFRNGTPEDIAVPYNAKIKDYISGYDRKTYEPINDDNNKLFSAWSRTSSSEGEQTKITDEDLMNAQEVTLYAIWKSVVEKIEEITSSDLSAVTLIQASDSSKDEEAINNMSPEDKTAAIAETLGKTENKETYTQAVETVSLYLNNNTTDLDENAKAQVEIVKDALAQANHKDTTNNVSVSAADGSELDWNIKLNVAPKEIVEEDLLGQDEELDEVLSSGSALVSFDISLATVYVNEDGVLDEEKYEPEQDKSVTLIVPSPIDQFLIDFGFDVTYIHFKDDGTKEYFSIKDGTLEAIGNGLLKLTVSSFSEFVATSGFMNCYVTFDLNDGTEAAFANKEVLYVLDNNGIYAVTDEFGIPSTQGENNIDQNPTVKMLIGKIDDQMAVQGLFDMLNRTAIAKNCEEKMFYKWNTKSDGTGTWLEPGAEVDAYQLVSAYEKENGSGSANENGGKKLTLYAIWVLPGDFNGDGKVNEDDYEILKQTYGKYGNNLPADAMGLGYNNLLSYSVLKQCYKPTNTEQAEETN